MKGIDISEFQEYVNYNELKAEGIEFVIIRCGYGKNAYQKDSKFEQHYKGCKQAGLKVGTYLYSYAQDVEGALKEAENTLNFIKGKTFELPVFYDVEDNGTTGQCAKSTITAMCKTWCNKIKEAGYKAGVYASLYWFEEKMNVKELEEYYIWLAQWNSTMDAKFKVDIWQYTSDGEIGAVEGRVDLNESYVVFPQPVEKPVETPYRFKNTSGKSIPVYCDLYMNEESTIIGSLNKNEECGCFGKMDNGALVLYEIDGSDHNWKVGFVNKEKGVIY